MQQLEGVGQAEPIKLLLSAVKGSTHKHLRVWLTEEMNSSAKHRPGSHRSRTAESLSLPGPLAVALKVMVEQQILLVNARQQACRPGEQDWSGP